MSKVTAKLIRALVSADANVLNTRLKIRKRDFHIDDRIKGEMAALHFATIFRRADIVEVLLRHGANVNVSNEESETCLHLAVEDLISNENLLRARKILKDVELDDELKDKLASAFSMETENQKEVREMLFGNSYNRPYSFVKYDNLVDNVPLIELLLRSGADPNIRCCFGCTTLMHCCRLRKKDARIIDLLFEHGADMRIKDNAGESALDLAAKHSSAEMMSELLDKAAGIEMVDPSAMQKFLNRAVCRRYGKDEDAHFVIPLVELLVKRGARLNGFDANGVTPLQTAVENSSLAVVKHLLSLGADPNFDGEEGDLKPALALAVLDSRCDIAECLIDAGADVFYKNPLDQSTLHKLAVQVVDATLPRDAERAWRCVTLLMERGLTVGDEHTSHDLDQSQLRLLENCQEELEDLKVTRICPESPVTYFNFLVKRDRALVRCLRNANIAEAIEPREYEEKFFYFAHRITANYERGCKQMEMIDELRSIFSEVFINIFPEEIIFMIGDYFDLQDLRNCFGNKG